MPENLLKLSPDRDLQVYFERPSAIAGLSEASSNAFNLTGTWRQQFDWAVVEWNQHNVFEHPAFRNLPDGDLSGLTLSYEETRQNCIPIDSDLYPTVDWPFLRIWTRENGVEDFFKVRIKDYATPVEGSYSPATADMQLQGSPTSGDYVGLSFLGEHFTYQVLGADSLESICQAIVDSVNNFSSYLEAVRIGTTVRLYYVGLNQNLSNSTTGANGNRFGVYGFVSGSATESWTTVSAGFSGGVSPSKWLITLPFGALTAIDNRPVPTQYVRKMRWTYAAELQAGAFARSEFAVNVSNWQVSGTGRGYLVAGPGSRRIEDDDAAISYSGAWSTGKGNFSGSSIRYCSATGASANLTYYCPDSHRLYVGTRLADGASAMTVSVDALAPFEVNLETPGEDTLARVLIAELGPGEHDVSIAHAGPNGKYLYLDFIEIAIPTADLPTFPSDPIVTLATDWDTDHSIAVPAERTAWMIYSLGFHGRANHYVGALWFYELYRKGHVYASATVDFSGVPEWSRITTLVIGREFEPGTTVLEHLHRVGDTAETIAVAFALELNRGYTAIRAEASGGVLTVFSRSMGEDGNVLTISASTNQPVGFTVAASGPKLSGGINGKWVTDLECVPRLNRAVRDWNRSFCARMKAYGIEVACAFSLELQHGDDSWEAGIAQRYPNGDAAWLNTPALHTNFSPESLAYWRQVHLDMADTLHEIGQTPYLQFGEVQWWYFPQAGSGMSFYDTYTKATFEAQYSRPMAVITSNEADPAAYPEEAQFLPWLIGQFTNAIMEFVRQTYPDAKFEVLYPTDVNQPRFNAVINYPADAWTPANLDNLKTESFTFTFVRNLDLADITVRYGATRGFPLSKRSFLVGIGDTYMPWRKEIEMAKGEGLESIVLFALDQFCLSGYEVPVTARFQRAARLG